MAGVQQWFTQIDRDRSGELDAAELKEALSLGNLQFSLTDVDSMIRAFDSRGRRKLSLPDFTKLHEFLSNVQSSFQYFDADRTGSLELKEVHSALQHAGFRLDGPVLQSLMLRCDPTNDGVLTLDEYIRMCLFLQSCARTFSAFDPQRQGRVTLDFNQFVYAASHLA